MLIYNKHNGLPYCVVSGSQNSINTLFTNKPQPFIDSMVEYLGDIPLNWSECKVVEGELVELSDLELLELDSHGRFLTVDERLEIDMLKKLTPSDEDIKKAENTIEILDILSGVLK